MKFEKAIIEIVEISVKDVISTSIQCTPPDMGDSGWG